ncbi:hypothetical protein EDC04DRAFT_1422608 [Pisolithus marmoratus]|nr:hypothetical protein EDC04DRAFT_1097728 [Pisolithus marmoratus]KAI6040819.1 hypothetical protein EDC04DRAFT_1422608 [Pisolithus marmoratus]
MSRQGWSGSFCVSNYTLIPSAGDSYTSQPAQIVNQTLHVIDSHVATTLPIYNQASPVNDATANGFHSVLPANNPSATYACQLGNGCPSPLEGTTTSIYLHLRNHGLIHKHRERAPCPWPRCSKPMRWGNVARHIIECHLDVTKECMYCGKTYKRSVDLNAHMILCFGTGYSSANLTETYTFFQQTL